MLFDSLKPNAPLSEQLRPQSLEHLYGQSDLLAQNHALSLMFQKNQFQSFILWGPPGCGKTSIARLVEKALPSTCVFEQISAIFSGVADIKRVIVEADARQSLGQKTFLFVDEIHRFNKSQQDSFLPYLEKGVITLIGATTENPSFELNSALLSRVQVFQLKPLDDEALRGILKRAEDFLQRSLNLESEAENALIEMAGGDGRALVNFIEALATFHGSETVGPITVAMLKDLIQRRPGNYDKKGENHYNVISCLHKSLRGSDCQAALYYLERMLSGGEDGNYIARRLVRFATEDIGLADPNALPQAIAAWQAYERLGSPEGNLALYQAAAYLATAPKSNALYVAEKAVQRAVESNVNIEVPLHLINPVTKMMKEQGCGKDYRYDHDFPHAYAGQDFLPKAFESKVFYQPTERGFEKEILKRIAFWKKLKEDQDSRNDRL